MAASRRGVAGVEDGAVRIVGLGDVEVREQIAGRGMHAGVQAANGGRAMGSCEPEIRGEVEVPLYVHGLACVPLTGRRSRGGARQGSLLGKRFSYKKWIQQNSGERDAAGRAEWVHLGSSPCWTGLYCRGTSAAICTVTANR